MNLKYDETIATSGHCDIEKDVLVNAIEQFIKEMKYRKINISNGGHINGWDYEICQYCIDNDISLILRLPFKSFNVKKMFLNYAKRNGHVSYLYNHYNPYSYPKRNIQVLNDAIKTKELHVLYDGRTHGGTLNTIITGKIRNFKINNYFKKSTE